MTDKQRREAVLNMIRDYAKEHAKSPKAAREALIASGIYTKKGNLRTEFGGTRGKAKTAA